MTNGPWPFTEMKKSKSANCQILKLAVRFISPLLGPGRNEHKVEFVERKIGEWSNHEAKTGLKGPNWLNIRFGGNEIHNSALMTYCNLSYCCIKSSDYSISRIYFAIKNVHSEIFTVFMKQKCDVPVLRFLSRILFWIYFSRKNFETKN